MNRFGRPVDIDIEIHPREHRLVCKTFYLRNLLIDPFKELPADTRCIALPSKEIDDFALFDRPFAFDIFASLVKKLRLPSTIDNLAAASRKNGDCIVVRGAYGSHKTRLCLSLAQSLSIRFCHLYRSFQAIELDAKDLIRNREELACKLIEDTFIAIDRMVERGNSTMYIILVKNLDQLNYAPLLQVAKGTTWISERGNAITMCTASEELAHDVIKSLYTDFDQWNVETPNTERVYGYLRDLYSYFPERFRDVPIPGMPIDELAEASPYEKGEFPVWDPSGEGLSKLSEDEMSLASRLVNVAGRAKEHNWHEIERMVHLSRRFIDGACSRDQFVKVLERGMSWLHSGRTSPMPELSRMESWLSNIEPGNPY